MHPLRQAAVVALYLIVCARSAAAQYSATYLPDNAPDKTESGQSGTNKCGTGWSQTSLCQNAYLNSVQDFCLFSPPESGPGSIIGNTERIEVAWCMMNGTGNRLIADGIIKGAHFVVTPDYVQVTGVGNLTGINVPPGDGGGELDSLGADGLGNPIGGLVFSNAFGALQQMHEWTNFVSDTQFCFRGCKPGPMSPIFCQHIYDVMGCNWNMPANYNPGVFEQCRADSGEPMGVYGGSTFHQGEPATPPPHPAPSSSSCTTYSTIGNGLVGAVSTRASSSQSGTSSGATGSKASSSGGAKQTASGGRRSFGAQTDIGRTLLINISMLFAVVFVYL